MKTFITITSPVFSELVVILREENIAYLQCEVVMFKILRKMSGIRPFKLVFLLEVSDPSQQKARQETEKALDFLAARGVIDFLDSPPIIRTTRFRQLRRRFYPPRA